MLSTTKTTDEIREVQVLESKLPITLSTTKKEESDKKKTEKEKRGLPLLMTYKDVHKFRAETYFS